MLLVQLTLIACLVGAITTIEPGQEEDEVRQIADYDTDEYGGLDYGPQDASKAGCADSYPTGYWKKCKATCSVLKKKKACGKKWSQVTTGNCKNGISASLRGKKVGAYCKKSCGGCGGNDADDLKSAFERIKQLEDQMKDLKEASSSVCTAAKALGNTVLTTSPFTSSPTQASANANFDIIANAINSIETPDC